MKAYFLDFHECLSDLENKEPLVIVGIHSEYPDKVFSAGVRRMKQFSKLFGLTYDGLPVYKEIDEEVKQP